MEKKVVGDVVILYPAGRMSIELGNDYLISDLEDYLEAGHQSFVINLLLVPFMESFGIGVLLRSHRLVEEAGGRLILCAVSGRVNQVLEMAHLRSMFSMTESEKDALADFRRLSDAS